LLALRIAIGAAFTGRKRPMSSTGLIENGLSRLSYDRARSTPFLTTNFYAIKHAESSFNGQKSLERRGPRQIDSCPQFSKFSCL
jgi:hypothetical protein